MMLSLPFLSRLAESGARIRILAVDALARRLLTAIGFECFADPEEARSWQPNAIMFLEPCRHLRATRHPERWRFVEEVLRVHPEVPVATPVMRSNEALSLHPGPYCTPFSGVTALSVLDRFADGLGLPKCERNLLDDWVVADPADRRGVVLNLSAGPPGTEDKRTVALETWAEVADALDGAATEVVVQPGDDVRRVEFEELQRQGRFRDVTAHCFDDIVEAARWLARKRLLVSPETGLCHLARNLAVPQVVLTPRRQVPYWYPPASNVRCVFAEDLSQLDGGSISRAIVDALGSA